MIPSVRYSIAPLYSTPVSCNPSTPGAPSTGIGGVMSSHSFHFPSLPSAPDRYSVDLRVVPCVSSPQSLEDPVWCFPVGRSTYRTKDSNRGDARHDPLSLGSYTALLVRRGVAPRVVPKGLSHFLPRYFGSHILWLARWSTVCTPFTPNRIRWGRMCG